MKLWLISQDEYTGYDVYDSAVVAAGTEDEARRIHPDGSGHTPESAWRERFTSVWASAQHRVTVEYLGEAKPGTLTGVICASFNAG